MGTMITNEWLNGLVGTLAIYVAIQRFLEIALAERNRRLALRRGALEFGAKHYPVFFFLHGCWLAGWVTEAVFRGILSSGWYLWFGCFILAQILKYWSISSLGSCWNTRILVIPGLKAIKKGPYRFIRHPNYLAVALELFSVPMIFGAVFTAVLAGVLNAVLLLCVRIPVEEDALVALEKFSET